MSFIIKLPKIIAKIGIKKNTGPKVETNPKRKTEPEVKMECKLQASLFITLKFTDLDYTDLARVNPNIEVLKRFFLFNIILLV